MTISYTPRPATTAPHGMVTCPHTLASQAGVDVYPHMTGLGGDAFWLIC